MSSSSAATRPRPSSRRRTADLGSKNDFRSLLKSIVSSSEYYNLNGASSSGFRAALNRDLFGEQPTSTQPGSGGLTSGQRSRLVKQALNSPKLLAYWFKLLARSVDRSPTSKETIAAASRNLARPGGFIREYASLLSTPKVMKALVKGAGVAAINPGQVSIMPGWTDMASFTPNLQTSALRPPATAGLTAGRYTPGTAPSDPFGNALTFSAVSYTDIMSGNPPPVPSLLLTNTLPQPSATQSMTIEMWFDAQSSGILLGQPMIFSNPILNLTPLAPLIYIDSQGRLNAGLFENNTPFQLVAGQTLVTAVDPTSQATFIGAPDPLVDGTPILDGNWHHVALVVSAPTATSGGQESLYVDGELVDTETASSSTGYFSLSFTDAAGQTYKPYGPPQLGGTIIPETIFDQLPPLTYPQGYVGSIDEVRFWSTAQSQQAIQTYMDIPFTQAPYNTSPPPGLVAYYSFDSPLTQEFVLPLTFADGAPLSSFQMTSSKVDNHVVFTGSASFQLPDDYALRPREPGVPDPDEDNEVDRSALLEFRGRGLGSADGQLQR